MYWPNPAPPVKDPAPIRFNRVAPHIRGRVYRGERLPNRWSRPRYMWHLEVVNTRTGKVLARDNCADFAAVAFECEQTTAAARATWFWSFKAKDVR